MVGTICQKPSISMLQTECVEYWDSDHQAWLIRPEQDKAAVLIGCRRTLVWRRVLSSLLTGSNTLPATTVLMLALLLQLRAQSTGIGPMYSFLAAVIGDAGTSARQCPRRSCALSPSANAPPGCCSGVVKALPAGRAIQRKRGSRKSLRAIGSEKPHVPTRSDIGAIMLVVWS